MNKIKKTRRGFYLVRIIIIALLGFYLATLFIQKAEAIETFAIDSPTEILKYLLPVTGVKKLPVTASPEWHPDDNRVGKHGVERVLVGDHFVEKICDQPSYACALSHDRDGILACTIYMPDFVRKDGAPVSYKGLYNRVGPGRKPPAEWFWLLGREKGHCLYGAYHD